MIPTPPQVITTKDLMYLKDELSWVLLAMKKCHHFAQEAQDPEVKQILDQVGKMHQRHYQLILKHCQTNNAQGMSQIAARMTQQQQNTQQPSF